LWRLWLDPRVFAESLGRYALAYGLVALLSLGVLAWMVRTRRRASRELEALEEIQASLEAQA
jgi:hypothetical protein